MAEIDRLTWEMVGVYTEATMIEAPSNPEIAVIHDMLLGSTELVSEGAWEALGGLADQDAAAVEAASAKVIEGAEMMTEATALLNEVTASLQS